MNNVVLIRHPKNWGLSEIMIADLSQKALEKRGYKQDCELSIYFVGKIKAKKLNQQYRKKDYIPQVLGFPMSRESDSDGVTRLGDIVICTQKLKYESKYQSKSLDQVVGEWLLHGVDNLLKG